MERETRFELATLCLGTHFSPSRLRRFQPAVRDGASYRSSQGRSGDRDFHPLDDDHVIVGNQLAFLD